MRSVLIVDDETPSRELLRRWLAPAGYLISEAPHAEAVLALVAAGAPDVVLCDVAMPGHDGLWLVQRFREHFPTIAVILATAVDAVPPAVSLQSSVVGYLVKPLDRERLLAAMSRAVGWHDATRTRNRTVASHPLDEWLGQRSSK